MHQIHSFLARKIGFNPLAWLRYARRMRALAVGFDRSFAPDGKPLRFVVVVTPWGGSGVPLFSLACGMLLASDGNAVTFVIDDLPFGDKVVRHRFILGCLRSIFRLLRRRYEVVDLSACRADAPRDSAARRLIDHLARLNATWRLRGEIAEAGRERFTEICRRQLEAAYGAIANVLVPGKYDVLFVPGGVYGSSGVWAAHGRAAGVRVATYDTGGYGTLMLAADGIACQLQDIPRAFAMLKPRCDAVAAERDFVVKSAQAEMARRRAGTDKFSSQVRGAGGAGGVQRRFDGAVLIALNSSWDSAALGLQAFFAGNTAWIIETTKSLLENTQATVIVRQHPAERLEIARTSDDYRELLRRHFGDHPRLCFIAADESVNSYDLLERVAAVVVHTSTIGIEAAIRGKPVITASNSYYSDLSFVRKAVDLPTYAALLADAAAGRLTVTPGMQMDAQYCYYLTQCTNWVFTPFNPADFVEWSQLSLDELHADDKVRSVLKALEEDVPVAFLNHLTMAGADVAGRQHAVA